MAERRSFGHEVTELFEEGTIATKTLLTKTTAVQPLRAVPGVDGGLDLGPAFEQRSITRTEAVDQLGESGPEDLRRHAAPGKGLVGQKIVKFEADGERRGAVNDDVVGQSVLGHRQQQ